MTSLGEQANEAETRLRTRVRRLALVLSLIALGAAVGLSWLLTRREEQPRLDRLPAEARAALFARTLADLQLCATSGDVLVDHCVQQAVFIESFPECDRSCRELASRWTTRATR